MISRFFRLPSLVSVALILAALLQPSAIPSRAQAANDARVNGFDLLAPGRGWLWLGNQLHWTNDDGRSWRNLTPLQAGQIFAVDFLDAERGWALLGEAGNLSIAKTVDAGQSWTAWRLDLPLDFSIHSIEMNWSDARSGSLTIQHATGANFDIRTTFTTSDGGRTWTSRGARDLSAARADPRLSLADGIESARMLTREIGWAKFAQGECDGKTTCRRAENIHSTRDGGRSWRILQLPGGDDADETRWSNPEPLSYIGNPGANTGFLSGQGIDTCEIPTANQLQTWWDKSPYAALNLYIGGSNRYCSNSALGASFLSQLDAQGWKFIPTWVGLQAPCYPYTADKMSWDVQTAYDEGAAEAQAAMSVARNLGLTFPDQSGSVIYFDLEAFPVSNAACLDAVLAFVSGWDDALENGGNRAGVYGATCSSGLDSIAALDNPPDAIWLANWFYNPAYRPDATVWNVSCLSNALWPNNQRLRQYAGTHTETWGGQLLSVDSNALEGVVASLSESAAPKQFSDDSYLIQYDGWVGAQDSASYGGGYRAANQKGQLLICKAPLAATEFRLITYKGPDQGKIQIFVDGALNQTADLYRSTPGWVKIKIGGLTQAKHTITVKILGTKNPASSGTQARVSGCQFGVFPVDDPSYDFQRLGGWIAKSDSRMDGGWYRLASALDASVSFWMNGTSFTWHTAKGPSFGKAEIIVDGAPWTTIDLYRAGFLKSAIPIGSLSEGVHQITIRVLRQKNDLSRGYGAPFDGFSIP